MDSKLNANRTRDRYRSRQTNRLTLTRKQRDRAREIGERRGGGRGETDTIREMWRDRETNRKNNNLTDTEVYRY